LRQGVVYLYAVYSIQTVVIDSSFTTKPLLLFYMKLECGPMPNVMAAKPNIGGALCESSRGIVWLTPAAGVLCSNAANIRERKTCTLTEFCRWHNSVKGKSDVAVVTKARRESR